ncbi:AraC family transcriptional regulator [Paenibacillus sp. OK003]|uniref:helix-turn-helix domain-containing protein n=1 Tax=Paenibacillus sp. OK003 TaxID=1884380 RepID=UPI0008BCCDD4|nr:AraC family transcriptional regulator [Paenibacillus sp. OK003]SEL55215.1 AraC-type DNA-binding protein [Paenibacillus sp. OK003]
MDFILLNTFQVTLMPHTFIKKNIQKNCFIYIKAKDEIKILNRKSKYVLRTGDEAIVNLENLVLCNEFEHISTVSGFLFRTRFSSNYLKKVYIMNESLFKEDIVIEPINTIKNSIIDTCQTCFSMEKCVINDKKIDTRLIKVNRYIRANYREMITLNMLSDLVETNPVYLCNSYSRVFGFPPIYHLNNLKINEAKVLLVHTSLTIKEIVATLGFSNSSQFSSLFKRYVRQSPIEFKDKMLNELIMNTVSMPK